MIDFIRHTSCFLFILNNNIYNTEVILQSLSGSFAEYIYILQSFVLSRAPISRDSWRRMHRRQNGQKFNANYASLAADSFDKLSFKNSWWQVVVNSQWGRTGYRCLMKWKPPFKREHALLCYLHLGLLLHESILEDKFRCILFKYCFLLCFCFFFF